MGGLAIVVTLLAATLGVGEIEDGLIDDVVDSAAASQVEPFGEFLFSEDFSALPIDEVLSIDESFFSEELEFYTELVGLADELGVIDELLAEADRSRDEGVPVLTVFGIVIVAGLDGAQTEIVGIDDIEGPLVSEVTLDEITSAAFNVEDVFGSEPPFAIDNDGLINLAGFGELHVDVAVRRHTVEGIEFVVAGDVSDVRRSVDRVRGVLWILVPLLAAAAAAAAWVMTGRALSPVKRMTSRVGDITSGTLHERVPVPATGDEIEDLASTMNAMLERIESGSLVMRQFVSDASHELRSPVAVLRSEAEVALKNAKDPETIELAEGMLAESLRLQRIVEDLLVLAHSDEGRAPADPIAVDVEEIVFEEAKRRRRVEVSTSNVSAGRVLGTEHGCVRVVAHLLDNAARHATTRVDIALETHDGTVTLIVDDDGPGVEPADRERVFERFVRLEEARTRDTGGAGLGLAVVAETIAQMNGAISVGDSPSDGARFAIAWPAA